MTERRKARVGDTIRHNGKNPAYKAGEQFVVTNVVDRVFKYGGYSSTYYVEYPMEGYYASAWEHQFDIVEPEPEFNKGDKVKLTPKDGGETVIYGEFQRDRDGLSTSYVLVKVDSDHGERSYDVAIWNIELVEPSTEEILNGLGENAFVAHRTVSGWSPYVKIEGKWRLLDEGYNDPDYVDNVAHYIDHEGFEIIFEGTKDE